MAPQSIMQRAFAAGELSPGLHARADLVKYATGLKTCHNWMVLQSGGVANRPGLRFIAECKTTSDDVKLLRYISEEHDDSLLIEHGLGYFRFFQNGARLTISAPPAWNAATNYVQGDLVADGGVNYYAKQASLNQDPPNATYWHPLTGSIYEVPAPQSADLYNFVQSGRTITLTHPDQPPYELTFVALTRWTMMPITTTPSIGPPTAGLTGTPGAAGARTIDYKITTAKAETYEESVGSSTITIAATSEGTVDAPNVLGWTAVPGAAEYYVYQDPYDNGIFGFIGTAVANAFNDVGLVPDFAVTPPLARSLFASVNNYPAVAAYHQQRRLFGFTNLEPEGIWGSRVGFVSNFSISSPLQDDDAITFRLMGNTHHPVRHLVGLKQLIVLTAAGGWSVGKPHEPLTPNNIPADQEVYVGSYDVPPVIVGNGILYVQARGKLFRELRFDQAVEGLAGKDLTIFSSHLFEQRTIGGVDYAHAPHSIVWVTQGGPAFLGMTYIPEQEVWGWHRHSSGASASFDDVCVVPEADGDMTYFIVKRTINAATVFYIERLEKRIIDPDDFDVDAFFVDSGLSYDGAPATVFSGLSHLNGQLVAVVGDGDVIFDGLAAGKSAAQITQFTVTGGSITLSSAKSVVHIGLAIPTPDIELLDLDVAGADGRDKQKAVHNLAVIVDRSTRSFNAGPDSTHLRQFVRQSWHAVEDEHTGQLEIALTASFTKAGRVLIRQTDPLPITILGVIPNLELGG
jgi:hypothetical protein